MSKGPFVVAIDQGTTSSRAIVFDRDGQQVSIVQQPIDVTYPQPGWVNQDARQLWSVTRDVFLQAVSEANLSVRELAGIGITNQRETTILWDRKTGEPLAPAIVWQSRQSAAIVDGLAAQGLEDMFQSKTGLVLDPYFSASKIRWLFDQDPGLESAAARGDVCFGTVDSWLIWNLTGGEHLTDQTNAARTLLFDIHTLEWSDDLLEALQIPRSILPTVVPSSGIMATTSPEFGSAPMSGCAGDQHAALFGQACFQPGQAKNTYGTGSFLLLNTGAAAVNSANGLLTTIGWNLSNETTYVLEGAVLVSGSAIQWLRDGLGIISASSEIEPLARSVPDSGGVVFVPALTGLGAPDWDEGARGTIVGITRGTTKAHLARATIEAIAFQVADVLTAMELDAGNPTAELRVDGGATRNQLLLQFQADISGVPVRRAQFQETTALGAAWLAGLGVGLWKTEGDLQVMWSCDAEFEPNMSEDERSSRRAVWRRAVDRSRDWA